MPGYWNAHSDRDFEDPLGLNESEPEPEIVVAPDLADDIALMEELALNFALIIRGMEHAFVDERDPYETRREALRALKQHLISTAGFIGKMERRAGL